MFRLLGGPGVGWIPPNSRWLLVGGIEKYGHAGRAAAMRPVVWRTLLSVSKEAVARLCFGATFVIAAFSLGLQFVQDWLGVWDDPNVVGPSHAVRIWRFFSYFTTQANLLVVMTSLGLAGGPVVTDRAGGWSGSTR